MFIFLTKYARRLDYASKGNQGILNQWDYKNIMIEINIMQS